MTWINRTVLLIYIQTVELSSYEPTETNYGDTPNGILACGHSTFDLALYVFPVSRDAAVVATSCPASASQCARR